MKTVVNWVIDKNIFEDYEDRLVDAINRSGAVVHFYDGQKYQNIETFLDKFFDGSYVLFFHGSLQHGRRVAKTKYYPGIYLTLENYECFRYYGYYGEHLLNSNYLMMGLNDVLRNKDKIFDIFGSLGSIFIRPSNGYKSFPGQMLPYDNFNQEFDILCKSYGGIDLDQLVVVSPVREINEEYRFIVVDGKVVSGALYMDTNNRKSWSAYYDKECSDLGAIIFANKMAEIYQPDRAYTLDVCKLANGDYKLIEINSFCCASMYGCNLEKVVDAVNNLCLNDYNDVF